MADQVMEDQLTFAAGVAGVDDSGNIFPCVDFLDEFELRFSLRDRFQIEAVGNDREVGDLPLPALDFDAFGGDQLKHVPDREGHDVTRPFEEVLFLLKPTERPGDVASH